MKASDQTHTPNPSLQSFEAPIRALVVGASGGIGSAFVRLLLEDAKLTTVFAACRNPGAASTLMKLADHHGERLRVLAMDVTDEASVAAAASQLTAEPSRLDLLINCAGLLHDGKSLAPERRIAEVEPGNLLRSFEVHAVGPALLAKHFGTLFDSTSRAVFASLSARVGSIGDNRLGGWYSYRASKAAHNMILRNISIELRRRARGLICVALHPGTVDTNLSRPFQGNVPDRQLFSVDRAARQLLAVIDGLSPESNGHFYAWDGQEIPW